MIEKQSTPWMLWPFVALARFLGEVFTLAGRLVGIALGVGLVAVGVLFSLSIIGSIIGIPIAVLGLILMARSFV